jgi:hypothetical protein
LVCLGSNRTQPMAQFAYQFGPRFNGACPSSPAAAIPNARTAGTSITETCTSARSRSACVPHHEDPWGWICGFYPGSEPGEYADGTAKTFKQARTDFERAWKVFLSKRTEADFQAWRDQRDWTERKYAMWERGERMPSQMPSSLMTCPCGETFDSHRLEHTVIHVPHITAAETRQTR